MFSLEWILSLFKMSLLPILPGTVVIVYGERVVVIGYRGNMIKYRRLKDGVEGICPVDWIEEQPSQDNVA